VALAWWGRRPEPVAPPDPELARVVLEGDEELLEYAVENWELLHDEDLDLWLASLAPLDELLIELADEPSWIETAPEETGR
jgi:hypothetical protein